MTGIGGTPRRSVVAEDIRNLQRWTGHDRRSLRRRLVLPALHGLLARLRQQIERARDAGLRYTLLIADLTRSESVDMVVKLAESHESLYWAAGVDPHQAASSVGSGFCASPRRRSKWTPVQSRSFAANAVRTFAAQTDMSL